MKCETEQAGEHQETARSQLAGPASQSRDESCERESLREPGKASCVCFHRAKRVKTLEGQHPGTGEGEG